MSTNFDDVKAFHEKFGVPVGSSPHRFYSKEDFLFRYGFMSEELFEFLTAHERDDLPGMADALIDLVYVAMGTAVWLGLPWQELWDEVQRANMSKVPAEKMPDGARHSFDVRKPPGWEPPDVEGVILRAQLRKSLGK